MSALTDVVIDGYCVAEVQVPAERYAYGVRKYYKTRPAIIPLGVLVTDAEHFVSIWADGAVTCTCRSDVCVHQRVAKSLLLPQPPRPGAKVA